MRNVDRDTALKEIAARANPDVSERRSHCFKLYRAASGNLAATTAASPVDTLVGFFETYGVLLTESGTLFSEQPEMEFMRGPLPYKEGSEEGVIVLFRQRVGNFVKQDTLIGGKFVSNELRMVGGCIHDPQRSPAQLGPVRLPDEEAARAAFQLELGEDRVTDDAWVRGFVWMEKGKAEWVFEAHRIDALTGEYLGLPEKLPSDPVIDNDAMKGVTP